MQQMQEILHVQNYWGCLGAMHRLKLFFLFWVFFVVVCVFLTLETREAPVPYILSTYLLTLHATCYAYGDKCTFYH